MKLFCDACSSVRYNFMYIHMNVYMNDAIRDGRRIVRPSSMALSSFWLCILGRCVFGHGGMHQRCLIGRIGENAPRSLELVSFTLTLSLQNLLRYPTIFEISTGPNNDFRLLLPREIFKEHIMFAAESPSSFVIRICEMLYLNAD